MRQKLNVRDMTVMPFTTTYGGGAFINSGPVVPFTLQFLFTTMAGLLPGKRSGALSVAVYVALGLYWACPFCRGGLGYLFRQLRLSDDGFAQEPG